MIIRIPLSPGDQAALIDAFIISYCNEISEKFENDTIEFDYLLKEGASHSTNAIRLLQYMGFDQRVVEEALAIIQANADENKTI